MHSAPLPPHEACRLQALDRYCILDTPPAEGFDNLTRLAAMICDAPMALISLIDQQRQWWKARLGIDATETSRDIAFCAHAILQPKLLEVPDALKDRRFYDNPLVTSAPYIRFYAGMPLITADGYALGTLCVLDRVSRQLTTSQREALTMLAIQVVAQLELHYQIEQMRQAEAERRRLEETLRLQERAIAASSSGIVITDARRPGNPIIYTNPSFERITGYTEAEALGQNCRFLQRSDRHQPGLDTLRQAIAEGKDCTVEVINYRKTDQPFWNQITISPLYDPEGQLTHFVGIQTDISDRKRTEAQLQQHLHDLEQARRDADAANQAKGEFLAMMSHEIRTPLNAVIGMTGLLLNTPLSDEQRDFAEITHHAGSTLLTIINDILDFSKIESGKLELEIQPFDLRACIEDALSLLTAKAVEKGLGLTYLLPADVPQHLRGDASRLRQVLVNLVHNAIKFTPQGTVTVSVEAQPAGAAAAALDTATSAPMTLQIAVNDTGIGIPADRLHRLFQPFSQVDASTTRQFGGTGLGLVIAQRLCALMGGELWVDSVEGVGSTFYVTLPAQLAPSPPATRAGNDPGCHRLTTAMDRPPQFDHSLGQRCPQRILLAEDNLVNQKVALKMLQRLGYRADVAANGLEVLATLERQPYDLVLMDVQMPEMDGLVATQQILQRWPTRRPRIVAMTANAMQGDRDRCLQAGMDDYISKPIHSEDLARVLKAGSGRSPTVDWASLHALEQALGHNDPNFMADLIASYLESSDQLLAEMVTAEQRQDWATLQRVAHTLKSSSATIGAVPLSTLCQELEKTVRQGDDQSHTPQIETIRQAAALVKIALDSALISQEVASHASSA
ncbi:GAF domain-containing hybrid sensor histidine kinase/response regulator [Nodosilinea nodulosa]|uniref:GAF domain-containing hybrid sensor histidine kinase/response regulator n=1 Tax=Nodosilinea nodulosa TaxID=416001 RepID=UPI0002D278DF|nr:GAF domain-containing hybrid sensor histidine kinase/response regulator [Nodosilinea nodulosa]